MTRPNLGPFTVSNLRHHRRHRTLAGMLALAGTVACGGENPAAPPPLETTASVAKAAPATASFLDASTPYAQAQNEVRSMETTSRSYDAEVGAPSGVGAPPTPTPIPGTYSVRKKGSDVSLSDPTIITPYYIPIGGCKKEYIDCVYDCLYMQLEYREQSAEFWRADADFWDNFLTGRHYLNGMYGGPQDRMGSAFYNMRQIYNRFHQNTCSQYVR